MIHSDEYLCQMGHDALLEYVRTLQVSLRDVTEERAKQEEELDRLRNRVAAEHALVLAAAEENAKLREALEQVYSLRPVRVFWDLETLAMLDKLLDGEAAMWRRVHKLSDNAVAP